MTITNEAFRKAMKEAGLEKVQLEKNGSYFYIWSDDETASSIILALESNSILTHAFKDMSIQEWVETIKAMMNEGLERHNDNEYSKPIIIKEGWWKNA